VDVCMYHGNCPDGACAAALVKVYLDAVGKACTFLPCWWESIDVAAVAGKVVVFVDITPAPTLLATIRAVARDVFVIDHHASAVATLHAHLHPGQFMYDNTECGASLTWDWLRHAPDATPPPILTAGAGGHPPLLPYIKALDLFDWGPLEAGGDADAMSMCRYLEVRAEPSVPGMEAVLLQGQAFLDHLRAQLSVVNPLLEYQITKCVASAEVQVLTRLPSIRVAVVNAQTFTNFVAHRLYTTMAVHVVWVYYYHGRSKRVRVSLRSNGAFDCNVYAMAYRGGGHPNSASFTCPDERSMRTHLCDPCMPHMIRTPL